MKHTAKNIREIPEFVVHIVSVDLLSVMEYSAKQIPYGTDEISIRDIHWLPSKTIRPHRVEEPLEGNILPEPGTSFPTKISS